MMDPPVYCPLCHRTLALVDSALVCSCSGDVGVNFKYYMSTNGFEIYDDIKSDGSKYLILSCDSNMNWLIQIQQAGTRMQHISKGEALDSFESGINLLRRYKNLLVFL